MKTIHHIQRIAVIGDGGWGTTLAIHLAHQKYPVTLWGPFPEYLAQVDRTRINAKFLPGIKIPQTVKISADLKQVTAAADLMVLAIPSQYLRQTIQPLKTFNLRHKTFLSVVKGIEEGTLKRISEIIQDELGQVRLAVLSGPTIAQEVAQGIPSTAVIAASNMALAQAIQKIFHSETFRIYTNSDVIGVELGGSIKNVIAIACGVCDGLGFGTNAKAAILTRGLAEMARLAQAMGAKPKTLFGLTGLGDLVTTCVSPNSRNRSVGEQLGKGKTIKTITNHMDMVAEGVSTVKAIVLLSKKYRVPMPITQEVYNIIYKQKNPQRAGNALMIRAIKAE